MKTIKNYIKYYACNYFKTSKGLTPLFMLIILIFFFYLDGEFTIEKFSISIIINFISASYASLLFYREDEVEEQILYLQTNNKILYFCSKLVFLLIVCFIYSLITMIIISSRYLLFLFTSPVVLIMIFILHVLCAWCGCILLAFLHPKIYKSQKKSGIIALFIILLYLLLPFIAVRYPMIYYISWIVAPIGNSLLEVMHGDSFEIWKGCVLAIILALYGLIYSFIFIKVIMKKRFKQ